MKTWLVAAALFLALLSTAANAQCVEVERAVAIVAADSQTTRNSLHRFRASPAGTSTLAEDLRRAVADAARSMRAYDQSIALLRRAIRTCPSGSQYQQLLVSYMRSRRIYADDVRIIGVAHAEALRPNQNRARIGMLLCQRIRAHAAEAGIPATC